MMLQELAVSPRVANNRMRFGDESAVFNLVKLIKYRRRVIKCVGVWSFD